jgi:hypothetical protein
MDFKKIPYGSAGPEWYAGLSPQQAQVVASFDNELYVQDRMDVQNTPLYDTIIIAEAGSLSQLTSAFFTDVGPASGKTYAQTNMSQQRKLAAPEAFSIFSMRFWFLDTVLRADIDTIFAGFAAEFFIGQKVYNRAPIFFYGFGGGLFATTTRTAESVYTNGVPTRESMHRLALPLVIENQAEFYGQLNGTTVTLTAVTSGGTGFTAMWLLDGLYARGVQ